MKRILVACCFLCVAPCFLAAGDEKPLAFREPPRVSAQGEQLNVTFTLSRRGDVEVSILDAKGKVVRHLAAGVLGGKNARPS